MSVSYRPRNDFIVFRMIEGNKVRGLVMPDIVCVIGKTPESE